VKELAGSCEKIKNLHRLKTVLKNAPCGSLPMVAAQYVAVST